MKFEKLGDCRAINPAVNVESNTIGDRFVFEKCLESGFTGQYTAIRSNDTIKVEIPKKDGPSERFKITLDIQTRPEYSVLSIDGSFFPVRVSR